MKRMKWANVWKKSLLAVSLIYIFQSSIHQSQVQSTKVTMHDVQITMNFIIGKDQKLMIIKYLKKLIVKLKRYKKRYSCKKCNGFV